MLKKHFKINYRWKILGALALTFVLPVFLLMINVPGVLVMISGVLMITSLTLYFSDRINDNIENLETIITKLGGRVDKKADKRSSDEFSGIISSLDHMVSTLETSYAKESKLAKKKAKIEEPIEAPSVRQSYPGHLSTGQSVVGELYVLPSRESESSSMSFSLTRREGLFLFHQSLPAVKDQLTELKEASFVGSSEKGIIDFQLRLLEDPALTEGIQKCLNDGMTLQGSLNTTFGAFMSRLERSKNTYIRGRAPDCMDLMYRLQNAIQHKVGQDLSSLYEEAKDKIVFCEQVYPTEVINLQKAGAKAIVSIEGTPSSHAQILLQSFFMPSVSDLDFDKSLPSGLEVMVDTMRRQLIVNPTVEDRKRVEHESSVTADVIEEPITLATGEPITVGVTINLPKAANFSLKCGADGVGLFRTEMSFLGRTDMPTEEQLYEEYVALTKSFPNKPVTMRMLDLGSDKIPFFHDVHHEENPCMGNRSMRLLIKQPALFTNQLRAMLRAATDQTTIIFPMISGWHELDIVCKKVEEVVDTFSATEFPNIRKVKYGLMVEVPSIVERFSDYVGEFSHFNLGTNDLIQYALAADRNNMEVAEYYNPCHPSILSMIHKVCRLAKEKGKTVCLCGEMAGQLHLLPLLTGLGVNNFSVSPNLIPHLKNRLKELEFEKCRALAEDALYCRSADEVERLLQASQASVEVEAEAVGAK